MFNGESMAVHRRKKTVVVEDTAADDQALEQMSQAFLENLKQLPKENTEAFDKYSDIVRIHYYSRLPNFEKRIVSGYHSLLKELSA